MPASWSLTPPYILAFGFLCGIVGFRMGWRTGNRFALPLVQGGVGWVGFLMGWTLLGPGWAAAAVGAWAVGSTVASVYVFLGRPAEADARVIRAPAYRAEMLEWLAAGKGPETHPGATILRHVRELIWYAAAAVLTGNAASIVMGAVLLNYMNVWVATLLRAAKRTAVVLAMAWNVWSVVRVAAYVSIGAALAGPVLRWLGFGVDAASARRLGIAGAAGAALDLTLKLALSRPCGRVLGSAVDLDAASANRSSEVPLSLHLD